MARLVLSKLSKSFCTPRGSEVRAVRELDLTVEEGELMVLVGPSGSGKTATLRLVAGLEFPSAGTITLDGRALNGVSARARDMAMVFQGHALYPHMSAWDNIAFGLRVRGYGRADIESQVCAAAGMLGIADCLGRRPGELSAGQRQRVAIARAIVRRPKLFLFDEPFACLDAQLRFQLRDELARLHAANGWTSLYVTHDQTEAITLGGRVAVLREGSVSQVGAPLELYEHPANSFVATFIGLPPMNLVAGRLVAAANEMSFASGDGEFRLAMPEPVRQRVCQWSGKEILLGIRPEHIEVAGPHSLGGSAARAWVERVEALGPETLIYATRGENRFVIRTGQLREITRGTEVNLWFRASAAHLFDPKSGQAL